MSNLGAYQTMTTTAKRLGGPYGLAAAVLAIGYVGGKLVEITIQAVVWYYRTKKDLCRSERLIKVTSTGTDGSGLSVNEGDIYRVLYTDSDMALIEKVEETNNPYIVSSDFLRAVSDFD